MPYGINLFLAGSIILGALQRRQDPSIQTRKAAKMNQKYRELSFFYLAPPRCIAACSSSVIEAIAFSAAKNASLSAPGGSICATK